MVHFNQICLLYLKSKDGDQHGNDLKMIKISTKCTKKLCFYISSSIRMWFNSLCIKRHDAI